MHELAPSPPVVAPPRNAARTARTAPPPAQVAAQPPLPAANLARSAGDALGTLLQRSILLRFKDAAQHARAQSDRAHALRTIALLRGNLKKASDDHLFKGTPLDGTAINPADPVGVHAYSAAGALPAGVVQVARRWSTGKVHQIDWHWAGHVKDPAKPSTMFPSWMPPDHVRTLIQLQYPGACETPLAELAGLPTDAKKAEVNAALHSDATKRYITRNTAIELQQLGSTAVKSYYPVDPA
jgi:hypothetical protein